MVNITFTLGTFIIDTMILATSCGHHFEQTDSTRTSIFHANRVLSLVLRVIGMVYPSFTKI